MSFYRIYRPQTIAEIDNSGIREHLLNFLHKDKKDLPHAYLFSGPKGTGKTTAARLVAKIFNCEKLSKSDGPCGICEQCRSIAKGNNLDVLEIDAASNRGIDEIRALREQISLAPVSGEYKVYVIDEVHMLTTEAFNALLKTLEEPPLHAVFVLATTDPHKVPVTIRSRCVSLLFTSAKEEELLKAMSRIVTKEKIDIEKEALVEIARLADGSFRDAAKLLEQLSFHQGKISDDTVRKTLVVSEEKHVNQFIDFLLTGEVKKDLDFIGRLVKEGQDIKQFLVDVLHKLEIQLIGDWGNTSVREAIKRFTQAYTELRTSPIPELPLELAIVEFCEQNAVGDTKQMVPEEMKSEKDDALDMSEGLLTIEKLQEHWSDVIASLKTYNHSVSGVLRSSRPKEVNSGIVAIEAFYKFHQEKLSEPKVLDVLAQTLKKLFGEKVKVEIVLGKK